MALLTLADLIDDVTDEIPGKAQAQIVRAANKVIRRIQTEFVEPVRTTFTTRASVSTGTVEVTQDSTTVTFSGSVLASTDPVMLLQVDGDQTWFVLTYVSGTGGTLSSKWAVATNSTATYTLVYPTVSFPNTVGEVLKVQQSGYEPLTFRVGGTCPWMTGVPTSWSPYYHDSASAAPSDDLTRIFLDPAPQERIAYEAWVRPRTAKLDSGGATSQTIPFSDLWYEAIVQGTLFFLWKQERNKDNAFASNALYEGALARARGSALPAAVIPRTNRRASAVAFDQRPITSG